MISAILSFIGFIYVVNKLLEFSPEYQTSDVKRRFEIIFLILVSILDYISSWFTKKKGS